MTYSKVDLGYSLLGSTSLNNQTDTKLAKPTLLAEKSSLKRATYMLSMLACSFETSSYIESISVQNYSDTN